MDREALKAILEKSAEFASSQFIKQNELIPMFRAVDVTGRQLLIAAPWTDEHSKVEILETLKIMFLLESVVAYTMISESWFKSFDKDEKGMTEFNSANKMVHEYDDKEEGLVVVGANLAGNKVAKMWKVIRGERHEFKKLTPIKEMERDEDLEGRMFELLKPNPVLSGFPPELKEHFRKLWEKILEDSEKRFGL